MSMFQYEAPGAPYPAAMNLSGQGELQPARLYYGYEDEGQFAKGGLVEAASKIRGAGRYGDSETIHINKEELAELTEMWGPPSINPETGMPEFFLKKVWKAVKKVAPIASLFIPVIGPALGTALGIGGMAGSALAGAALGGISGGAKGAITGGIGGAVAGGLGGKIGAMAGIKDPRIANIVGRGIAGIGGGIIANVATGGGGGGGGAAASGATPSAPAGIGGLGFGDRLTYEPVSRTQNPITYDPRTYGQTGGEFRFFNDPIYKIGSEPVKKSGGGDMPPRDDDDDGPSDSMLQHLMTYMKRGGHEGPGAVRGIGSGQEDKIAAWLSDGEYVWSAQDVADLGDGSTDEGVRRLDKMRHMVRRGAGRKNVKSIAKPQRGIDQMLKAVGGPV